MISLVFIERIGDGGGVGVDRLVFWYGKPKGRRSRIVSGYSVVGSSIPRKIGDRSIKRNETTKSRI